jgi:hypothetical protein
VSSPVNDLGRSAVKRRINAVWGALLALVVAPRISRTVVGMAWIS